MYSKAQLKIQEMAFILVAIVFLFSLVFLFFARFQYAQMQEQAKVLREFRTVQLLRAVAGLPELQCPSGSFPLVCIDEEKAKQFNESEELRESFSELWENSKIVKIKVEEIWPEKKEYLIYNSSGKNIVVYATYVPLCSQSCVIAKIKIGVERP